MGKKKILAMSGLALLGAVTLFIAAPTVAMAGEDIGPLPKRKAPKASMVEMGKRLFYDARISGDGAISCATCHDPRKGFGDGQPLSKAYPGSDYFRNSATLLNVVYKSGFSDVGWGWDGRMGSSLNDVMRDQITETTILNLDMRILHERMKQDPTYVKMCKENFNGECSSGKARKALIAYVETLVSTGDAPFDKGNMSKDAKAGMKLFKGKAGCIKCHNGSYFSDGKPHNTGVAENLEVFKNAVRHATYRAVLTTYGVPKGGQWRRDVGYFFTSKKYADVGKFITPTLRELKYTAPYMHNGTIKSLKDVVEFYNNGGGHDDPLARELKKLGLSSGEKKQLVAFLESLSSPKQPGKIDPPKIPQEYPVIEDWLNKKN
ncbi:MAG: photosynthetic protein synthase I [Deltaproteobacteria bacterium]|nr:photosynthetic protein synthase I [Deltaproteobacteria bacterium]